jgi:hypothetical protein
VVGEGAEGGTEHCPDEQGAGGHPAGAADADGQAGGEDLAERQDEQERERVAAGDGVTEDGGSPRRTSAAAPAAPAEQQTTDRGA